MDQLNAQSRSRSCGGITLVEVTISLLILAFGLLGIMVMQVYSLQGGERGRHLTRASAIARDQLEQLHRLPFGDAQLADTSALPGPPAGFTAPVQVNEIVQAAPDRVEQAYAVAWRVSDLGPSLKAIDVRVTWDEPDRPGRETALSTVRHDDP